MGAESIQILLKELDLEGVIEDIQDERSISSKAWLFENNEEFQMLL